MDILFWSGGKDSYFCYERLRKKSDREIRLLTTYDEEREMLPHHNIGLDTIRKQAKHLDLELITVALPPECPNDTYISRVSDCLSSLDEPIDHLVFGDWKNEEIRAWREDVFTKQLGYACLFPIWGASLHDLIPILTLTPVNAKISAVQQDYSNILRVGETYDQRLIAQLPKEVDPMGEYGEFHTVISFQSFRNPV